MRVIGGSLRGRRVDFKLPPGIRPTTDRVRESLFSILSNIIDFSEFQVIDAFSGAGSLWLESVSRGANNVISIDKSSRAINFQKRYTKEFGLTATIKFRIGDALKLVEEILASVESNNLIMFADPPYDKGYVKKITELFCSNGSLGLLVIESSKLEIPLANDMDIIVQKNYGNSIITVLQNKTD